MDEMPDPTDDPALAAFTEDLRTIAAGPAPEPRPGLLAVMFQGASVPIDSCPGRRKMLVKTFVGSLAAKVALGMGVAAASMTAAGAAGVLPSPAQHAMASVVGATTPFVLPDPSTVTVQSGHDTPTSSTVTARAGGTEDGAIVGAAADKNGNAGAVTDKSGNAGTVTSDDKVGAVADNHGACVSAVAGSGGKTVSSVARSDCGKAGTSTSTSSTSTSTTSTTVAGSADRTANSGPGSANSGRGNSGSGSANSGKGNSGKS
jgi:hypothetical protein